MEVLADDADAEATADPDALPEGLVYPLNSKRLPSRHLHKLAEELGLPSKASADETLQMIEGALVDMNREPQNVQVIVQ